MPELRILSGLHRGAALPLGEYRVDIGSSEDADVVLLDHGIQPLHASLQSVGGAWLLSMIEGEVLSADSNSPVSSVEILLGAYARLGRVWITIAAADSPWSDPPPEPVDMERDEFPDGAEGERDLLSEDPDDTGESGEIEDRLAAEPDLQVTCEEPEVLHASPPPSAVASSSNSHGRFGWRHLFGAVILFVLLAAAAAFGLVGGSPPAGTAKAASLKQSAPQALRRTENILGPIELRTAFRKRLAEVDLLDSFDLDLHDHQWTMKATLDDSETARFERVLAAFVQQHRITIPIHASVGRPEHMLPFKIQQVISGANASVVTLDGNRLYIGDEYKGVRLVAIKGRRVSFKGSRNIEVNW